MPWCCQVEMTQRLFWQLIMETGFCRVQINSKASKRSENKIFRILSIQSSTIRNLFNIWILIFWSNYSIISRLTFKILMVSQTRISWARFGNWRKLHLFSWKMKIFRKLLDVLFTVDIIMKVRHSFNGLTQIFSWDRGIQGLKLE